MDLCDSRTSPLVSVVVPNYNHARYLPRRLDSILTQTFQNFELILLDDCSGDDSRKILFSYSKKDSRIKLLFNSINSGSTFKQWNKGAQSAMGKYIWLAESDDFADPAFLERMVPLLEADPTCTIAFCQSYVVDENSNSLGILPLFNSYPNPAQWDHDFVQRGDLEIISNFVWGTPIQNASATLIRKSAFLAVGGADESFRLAGDWKLYVDLLLNGTLAYVSEPLNYFRRHLVTVRNTSGSSGRDIEEAYRIFNYIRSKVMLSSTVVKKRRWQLARWRAGSQGKFDLSQERKAGIAQAANLADSHAGLRFAVAKTELAARDFARKIRDVLFRRQTFMASVSEVESTPVSRDSKAI